VELAGPVRPSAVVVLDVFGERGVEVPLAQDQYAVGEFGSGGEYEPFGVAVRPWTTRRDLYCVAGSLLS